MNYKWYILGGGAGLLAIFVVGCGGCTGIVGGVLWWNAGAHTRLEKQTEGMVAAKEGKQINRVRLVKKNDTEYDGVVYAADGCEGTIHVTYDGNNVLARWWWKL
jgi:hypothetical protein